MALHTSADVAQNSHLASSVGFIKGAFDALSEFGQGFASEEGSQVVILRDKCLQILGLVMTCPYLIMEKNGITVCPVYDRLNHKWKKIGFCLQEMC